MIASILNKHNIRTSTSSFIVQDVRSIYMNHGVAGLHNLIERIGGSFVELPRNGKAALFTAQYIVLDCFNKNDNEINLEAANQYVSNMQTDANHWMFMEGNNAPSTTVVVRTNDSGEQVVTQARGTKATMAEELYIKEIINGSQPRTRKEIVELFAAQLGMTPAGASTYFSNVRAKLGDPKSLIQRSGRGRK